MTVTLKYFGSIVDITQKKEESFFAEEPILPVSVLKNKLETAYEELKRTNYSIAVNQAMSSLDTKLKDQDVIAFLPPFAGG
ncbi:MoaD/ThiS family protein [Flavobacterium adhaerens]|uniref:MoaD/ThiS family protein n=1 Tax=Flavobacterium adhaerens TaxID=3149043 RepID=UPI0032B3A243